MKLGKPSPKGLYVRISLEAHQTLKLLAKAQKRSLVGQAAYELEARLIEVKNESR